MLTVEGGRTILSYIYSWQTRDCLMVYCLHDGGISITYSVQLYVTPLSIFQNREINNLGFLFQPGLSIEIGSDRVSKTAITIYMSDPSSRFDACSHTSPAYTTSKSRISIKKEKQIHKPRPGELVRSWYDTFVAC